MKGPPRTVTDEGVDLRVKTEDPYPHFQIALFIGTYAGMEGFTDTSFDSF
jgi:hypothetical protein